MKYTYLHYQIAMTLLYGVGPIKGKALLQLVPDMEELFHSRPGALEKTTRIKAQFFKEMKRQEALQKAEMVVQHLQQHRITAHFISDESYPQRLKNCVDAPLVLYQKGDLSLNDQKFVAIVGTRGATCYGKKLCQELIEAFTGLNIVVVSGLALGIDGIAHRTCLDVGVPTIGVLGHGLDRLYPSEHRSLAKEMIRAGALLTEFVPGTMPDRENFPKRNRVVAGLCDATIVVESQKKGGSLITANLANDYNRDVFAFPGNIDTKTSQGCNQLIAAQQAHLIQSPSDFLSMMNWQNASPKKNAQRSILPTLTQLQQKIVRLILANKRVQQDFLAMQLQLPVATLSHELFELELSGVVRSQPGNYYTA